MIRTVRRRVPGAWEAAVRVGHRATLVAVLLILSACAARPPVERVQIPVDAARRTLSVGFEQLSERYVDYLPVGVLAFEGLRGLNAIDPAFEARRDGETIVFGIEGQNSHTFTVPSDADAERWAVLTVEAVRMIGEESRPIALASIEKIYEAIFDGSLSLLDAYSRYAGAEEASLNREKRSGFGGIGIVVQNSARGALVVQVFDDSPAVQAGLREGDVITHIDSEPVGSVRSPDISEAVRGPVGTNVALRIERANGESFDVDLVRRRVITPTVHVSDRNNIITARITGFNRATTGQLAAQLSETIQRLDGAARGIVLDLRGNPGGLLSEAVRMADLFIAEGRIVTTQGRHPASMHDYEAREDDVAGGLPIVVVVNGRSASASEIVAAALQDHERAVVIGSVSYGKGTVQTVIPLPNDGELTVTWSRFVTPSGYALNGLGVRPSICTNAVEATADQLIKRAVSSGADLIDTFQTWRGIDRRPDVDRKNLKAVCPASDRAGDLDGSIAESLIVDHGLYNRVLAFAPMSVAARK